jgi:E3 ubiquitin-protein ligase HUWE1
MQSPFVKDFRNSACSISLPLLPQHLATFPSRWPFPRGDLYHWIPLLNRFDVVLDRFCKTYKLDEGPQTVDFAYTLLESGIGEPEDGPHDSHNLQELGYEKDGDRQLVESILNFSRMLLQNCGNRSIYASSSHLNSLLNSTSMSLLESTLHLGSELAQRYQAAMKRMSIPVRNVSNAILANHYNIDLDRVLQLALPFAKTVTTTAEAAPPTTPATPTVKGKEKAVFSVSAPSQKPTNTTIYANDLVSMVKGGNGVSKSPKSIRNEVEAPSPSSAVSWEEWGDVKVTYYPKTAPETEANNNSPLSNSPSTPTPIRRSSNLGPHGQRSNRQTSSDDSSSLNRASTFPSSTDDVPRQNFRIIEIPSSRIRSTSVHQLLRENISGLPQELQYELLTKLRVADALTTSLEKRRQILAVRLLAITNLAYIHSEPVLQETVLKQDAEEPRRLQLAFQLAELVHPPAEGDIPVPRHLQTLAFSALDALSQHQTKFTDVCSALNTSVNHGVLLYVVRKAVAEMSIEDEGDKASEEDEWRDALFSLLSNLCVTQRTASDLVTAGLIPVLVELLNLRTSIAERYHARVSGFLDNMMYGNRDPFQALVNADGLDAISNLIVYEVKTSSENAASGKGMRPEYRSAAVDYDIPFFQQQTLKWIFKFIHHLMTNVGSFGGNFDRLLRNLIDSSQLLGSLRKIIENARCFGSTVWTHAVSILNDFINNEPTSFAIIAEAGLSRGLLEAVTQTTISMPPDTRNTESQTDETAAPNPASSSPIPAPSDMDDSEDEAAATTDRPSLAMLQAPREGPLARGILPTSETISIIPQAFGAICLNNAGMKMFQASKALESFLEIFESPEHVKCMDVNKDLPASLGSAFDELVRHHPPLKTAIMNSILNMVARVAYLCKTKAEKDKVGAKLWTTDLSGKPVIADQQIKSSLQKSSKGKRKAIYDGNDVEMQDTDSEIDNTLSMPPSSAGDSGVNASMTPYVTAVASFLSATFGNASVRSDFSNKGGIEYVLDLAESPCLSYDFAEGRAGHTLYAVIGMLADSKPHLTIPSLLKRAQSAADALAPFANHSGEGAFFAPFVNPDARRSADIDLLTNGTTFVKSLVNVHTLVLTLHQCFHNSTYNHRSASNSFSQLNVADYYVRLVQSLGPLLGSSLREEMKLQKSVPEYWKHATRVKDSGFGEPVADTILGVEPPTPAVEVPDVDTPSAEVASSSPAVDAPAPAPSSTTPTPEDKKPKFPTKFEQDTPYFKNFQTLRFLLSKMSRNITPFFQTLGKSLVTKRHPDPFQRQSHLAIAEAMADNVLKQLTSMGDESSVENYSYWIGMLHALRDMLLDGK